MIRFLGSLILVAIVAAMIAAALRPICVPLKPSDLPKASVPFDERTEKDLFFLKIYQRRDKAPYECKTWLTRQVLE
jgi:hypothetical protein